MFSKFALSMMNGRAFAPMMNADTGGGAGSSAGEPGAGTGDNPDGAGGTGDDKDQDKGSEPEKLTFTEAQQAHIDKLIGQKAAEFRSKAEADAAEKIRLAEERAKMTAEEKAEADRKDREKAIAERETAANNRIINLELKAAASGAGVPAKKLERFLKVVSREEIEVDENGSVDQTKVAAAIREVLDEMPEFKGSGQQQGPGGDFNGQSGSVKYTPAQIAEMTPAEISKDWDEIQKSMAFHNKK